MGRAVHYRVHALTGLASAKRNIEDESCLTFARSLIPRPAQAAKAYSARDSDHEDKRKLRWHARVDKRDLTFQLCQRNSNGAAWFS
mmetsp:Transcript_6825/g.15335  ORF Transcript_6825/g.15335 Transcript_6825/m.15335 type:complete len:86 (+) Transcript_6825:2522-2779(+)